MSYLKWSKNVVGRSMVGVVKSVTLHSKGGISSVFYQPKESFDRSWEQI